MKIVGVIPARWASTRFEGKILAPILGKPMIQHVWERVKKSKALDDVIIACDEDNVLEKVQSFGAKAILTSKNHQTGTDRIIEAVSELDVDIVVNIQGDEPLICHSVIDKLCEAIEEDSDCSMATVIKKIEGDDDLTDENVVKVVIDKENNALYFSRSVIPFQRDARNEGVEGYFKHLGIYAYRKEFLLNYNNLPESRLEKMENLEQLRAVEAGIKIKTVVTDIETIGVDTPDDLKNVEKKLKADAK